MAETKPQTRAVWAVKRAEAAAERRGEARLATRLETAALRGELIPALAVATRSLREARA